MRQNNSYQRNTVSGKKVSPISDNNIILPNDVYYETLEAFKSFSDSLLKGQDVSAQERAMIVELIQDSAKNCSISAMNSACNNMAELISQHCEKVLETLLDYEQWQYPEYLPHLETLYVKVILREKARSRGAQRLLFLINNAPQASSPYNIYRATATHSSNQEPFLLDIPLYDYRYIREMRSRLGVLTKLAAEKTLTESEAFELDFINRELKNANGITNGKEYTAKRENRMSCFKKPEDNRSYAALKMSMMRLFPVGSKQYTILTKRLRFQSGKFSWSNSNAA